MTPGTPHRVTGWRLREETAALGLPVVNRTGIAYDRTRNAYDTAGVERDVGPLARALREDPPPGPRPVVRPPRALALPSPDRPADRLCPRGRAAGARSALARGPSQPNHHRSPGSFSGESRRRDLPGAAGLATQDGRSRRRSARGAGTAGRADPSGLRLWIGCTRRPTRRQRYRPLRRRRRCLRRRGPRPDPGAGTAGTGRESHCVSTRRVSREGQGGPPLRDKCPARAACVCDRKLQ
jgi:hypothetical protein